MSNRALHGISVYRLLLVVTLLSILALGLVPLAHGQAKLASPVSSPTPSVTPTPAVTPTPSPIPLAEVVTQAEAVLIELSKIEADPDSDQIAATVDGALPGLTREIDTRLGIDRQMLNSHPSLEALRNADEEWKTIGADLRDWRRDLTTRGIALEQELGRLMQLNLIWSSTLEQAQASPGPAEQSASAETLPAEAVTPAEILQRMRAVIAAIQNTRAIVEARRARVLNLQNRIAEQGARINEAVGMVRLAREQAVSRLFVKDSPAIWSAEVRTRNGGNLLRDTRASLNDQWAVLKDYVKLQWESLLLHAITLVVLVIGLLWVRRRVRPWVAEEPGLEGVARVFKTPIATALVLSILLSGWIYPRAPRMLIAILGAAALIPTISILRRQIERQLFPILNTLVIFYFIDQLRAITAALPTLSRLIFLAEMLAGVIFFIWFIRLSQISNAAETERRRWFSAKLGARIAGASFLAAFIANALGYTSVSLLVGNAVLRSAYLAVILYAAVRIADGLMMFALRIRPFSLLGMVRRHRPLLRERIHRWLRVGAISLWALYVLTVLSLRTPLFDKTLAALRAELRVGTLHLSLGNVLAFFITVYLAFLLSKFLRFLLDEDIYPRVSLARGVPYAMSTMLHYAILLVGFLFAVAALGIDMTKFTILAGAFGVGLGFGLQSIVNNFFSGLILLFERPVHVGDVIQVGERSGRLRRIGMRASVIRTLEGSEVILPNGKLISEEVLNWTLSDQQRRMEVAVGVAYGTDPERVIRLLTEVASEHPEILQEPPPETLFIGFGDSAINFQLRAWTSRFERWQVIKSELTLGVNAALRDAEINIPFPQRDLHIRTIGSSDRK